MSKKVTVSLLTYNGARYLPYCLPSLFSQTFSDWQLVICDNGSSDDSVAVVSELTQGRENVVLLAAAPHNIGFAAGHNKIIKQTDSDYVLLLNQDILLAPDYLEKLVLFLDKNPSAAAVSGLFLHWDFNNVQTEGKGKKDIIDSAGLRAHRSCQVSEWGARPPSHAKRVGQAGESTDGRYAKTHEVFGVSGALPLLRRRALVAAGFFDERFFSYKEDVDLAFRLQSAGWQSFCVGEARAWHDRGLAGGGTAALSVAKNRAKKSAIGNYLSYRNHWFILIKDVALRDWLCYGIVILWYELQKAVYLLLFEPKTLLAWREIFQSLPALLQERKKIKPKSIKKWLWTSHLSS